MKSRWERFYRYKYSGPIVFVPLIIGIASIFVMSSTSDFYTAWSCDTIQNYMNDENVPERFTPYDSITDQQRKNIDRIHQECVEFQPFMAPP